MLRGMREPLMISKERRVKMGGWGSGTGRKHCEKELTADYCCLDVQLLKRRGFIYLGRDTLGPSGFALVYDALAGFAQLTGNQLAVGIYPNHIVVTDPTNGPYGTSIALLRTPCTFGGTRVWFRCPNGTCGRRVAVLYLAGEIKCRTCAQLRYQSQYESQSKRNLRKCQLIRLELGGSPNLLKLFPPKPPGMRWASYQSLWDRASRAETSYWGAEGRRVSKLLARYK